MWGNTMAGDEELGVYTSKVILPARGRIRGGL